MRDLWVLSGAERFTAAFSKLVGKMAKGAAAANLAKARALVPISASISGPGPNPNMFNDRLVGERGLFARPVPACVKSG